MLLSSILLLTSSLLTARAYPEQHFKAAEAGLLYNEPDPVESRLYNREMENTKHGTSPSSRVSSASGSSIGASTVKTQSDVASKSSFGQAREYLRAFKGNKSKVNRPGMRHRFGSFFRGKKAQECVETDYHTWKISESSFGTLEFIYKETCEEVEEKIKGIEIKSGDGEHDPKAAFDEFLEKVKTRERTRYNELWAEKDKEEAKRKADLANKKLGNTPVADSPWGWYTLGEMKLAQYRDRNGNDVTVTR